MPTSDKFRNPIGQAWLRRELGLEVPQAAVESYVAASARRVETHGRRTLEFYPRAYDPGRSAISHLRFALRHEPIHPGILIAALRAIKTKDLEDWIRAQPTGIFSRRAWFWYETFTGRTLDVDDARTGNYIGALDPQKHVVTGRRNSPRHRVVDNLLGGPGFCPVIRRTSCLEKWIKSQADNRQRLRLLADGYSKEIFDQAINYLYTKETNASFELEGETPGVSRSQRFINALRAAPAFDLSDKTALVRLQGDIVDPRYAAKNWRTTQVFISRQTSRNFPPVGIGFQHQQEVRFICPRPEDVPELMGAWVASTQRVVESTEIDPITAAAVSSFAFVFIHPFDDGNGRIHRFLMHHVLAKRGYSPQGAILPVSAAILRDRKNYHEVLNVFSSPLFRYIVWNWTDDLGIKVTNETADLYRYFDATPFVEYLHDRVADTIHKDLKEELSFLATFDPALNAVHEIVDMPDRRASLFVRLCMQNGGRLSARKRSQFQDLEDSEIARMEAAVQDAMEKHGSGLASSTAP